MKEAYAKLGKGRHIRLLLGFSIKQLETSTDYAKETPESSVEPNQKLCPIPRRSLTHLVHTRMLVSL